MSTASSQAIRSGALNTPCPCTFCRYEFDCPGAQEFVSGKGSVPSRLTLVTWYVCWFQTERVLTHLSEGDLSALSPTVFEVPALAQGQSKKQVLFAGTTIRARPVPSMSAPIAIPYALH